MTTTDTTARGYRIAEIAELSGFSASTLRYYEEVGVLVAPERAPAGYRLYRDRDLDRLRLIARAKDLGCSLEEITDLVRAWEEDECGPVKHRLRALVRAKVVEVEAHLAEQAAFAGLLRDTATALAGRPLDGPCDQSCGCATIASSRDCGTQCDCTTTDGDLQPGRRSDDSDTAPIACSLAGPDVGERLEDWRRILRGVTDRRAVADGIRLEIGDRTGVAELAALVEAEQTCCPFFSFAITVDQRGLALEVSAPATGQQLLATVFEAT